MSTFRAALLFLLLACGAAPAPADDKPAAPAKKDDRHVYPEEEWIEKVKSMNAVDIVGFKKKDVMARECSKSVVRVKVKIWDIRSTRDGISIDVVDVVPTTGERLSRDSISLSAEDAEAVKEWKRWDRLAFRVEPKVTPDGAIQYTRMITRATDVDRTPNPGIEYPPQKHALADVDCFDDFVGRYKNACAAVEWKSAWRVYCAATQRYYPMTAVVKQGVVDAAGRGPRGPANIAFDILKSTGVANYGYCDAAGHPMTSTQVQVDDPQAIEALKTGAKAEILFHVQGITSREDLEVRQGKFQVVTSFGRVREK